MKYDLLEDTELLILLKEGNVYAYKEIYIRYWRPLYLVVYQKLKNKEIAQELTQDLFVSLWERKNTFEILNLKNYLFGSIKYSIINFIKSQIVEEKYVSYVKGQLDEREYSTEQLIIFKDLTEAIEKGIAMLPQKTQEIFKLSRIENYSVKEISKEFNISEKGVEYHITQSLKVMKRHLKDYLMLL